jgi:hypothetical protein
MSSRFRDHRPKDVSARQDSEERRKAASLLLQRLKLNLPNQPPPKITTAQAEIAPLV